MSAAQEKDELLKEKNAQLDAAVVSESRLYPVHLLVSMNRVDGMNFFLWPAEWQQQAGGSFGSSSVAE